MADPMPSGANVPEARAVTRHNTRLSVVWIVPAIAALVGVWVGIAKIRSEGPTITIGFDTAEGLEAGKTKIRYNGVDVGTLTTIRLSDDHRGVVATAQMEPKTEDFLVDDTRFWVVRPRISGATVTGLGTLISGAYIGMDIGSSKSRKREFTALTTAPVVTRDLPGRFFVLKTPDLGSLDTGTPVYFRRLQVGEVSSYDLSADGKSFAVKVFVNTPYDRFVTSDTRFWHASGIDMSLTAAGLTVQTQSALSILIGGVAFETPLASTAVEPAAAETEFTLFTDRALAFRPPRGDPQPWQLAFKQSVRGLERGAPVEFQGIPIGEVTDIRSQFDDRTREFSVLVLADVYPEMLGGDVRVMDLHAPGGLERRRERLDGLTAHGLRAQLQSGSLVTGALYVALDFFPDAPPAAIDWAASPPRFPTTPGTLKGIETTLTRIVDKLDKIPLDAIGDELRLTLVGARKTLGSAERTLNGAGQAIAPDSPLQANLNTTLADVSRAAKTLNDLLDYLDRHPEALLRGKTGEPKQ